MRKSQRLKRKSRIFRRSSKELNAKKTELENLGNHQHCPRYGHGQGSDHGVLSAMKPAKADIPKILDTEVSEMTKRKGIRLLATLALCFSLCFLVHSSGICLCGRYRTGASGHGGYSARGNP